MQAQTTATAPRRLFAFLLLGALTAVTAQAQTQFYETVLHLQEPVVNVSSVDRVIYRWSTTQVGGTVTEFALEDLTLELRTLSGEVFIDRILVNGVVQPLSGMARFLGDTNDIYWRYNLDTATLEQMANVSSTVIEASTGLHFDVHDSITIPDDGRVSVKAYIDGVNQDPHTDQLATQTTAPMIFFDDFESGDLSAWSSLTTP